MYGSVTYIKLGKLVFMQAAYRATVAVVELICGCGCDLDMA